MSDKTDRCWWCGEDPLYQAYHDREWGRPVTDNTRLFEKICLEGFQAGLSWITILRKRENFRAVFDGFDYNKVARYDAHKIDALLKNEGIIRHRGKIESTINNAARAIEMEREFGTLAAYFWRFEPKENDRPIAFDEATLRKTTTAQAASLLSKDLKKRGWKFVGPTTMYAFMQAMGMVNDHVDGCHCRGPIETQRREFCRPV